jgi:RNA polymerase sigma factor (sigma-70 family)
MSEPGRPVDRTRVSLLVRVRDPRDSTAWRDFHALYSPLLERFACGLGLGQDDADDVVGDCLATLARELPTFEYDAARGGFKGWLYTLARARAYDRLRRRRTVPLDSDIGAAAWQTEEATPVDELWERTWQSEHLRFAVAAVEDLVSPRSFEVFHLMLFQGLGAAQVGARLGLNENQVYKARARVLAKVRELLTRIGVEAPIPVKTRQ